MRRNTSADRPHERLAWVDAGAGVAGDMLLAALLDAGASLETVQAAVDAVVPDTVRIGVQETSRGGLRAMRVVVELVRPDQPHRAWREIRGLIAGAQLPERVAAHALDVFGRLAQAEARVHGVAVEDIEFHDVGAWDAIADVVGVCAALEDLRVSTLIVGRVALGAGSVDGPHGRLPVPVPAVLELLAGSGLFTRAEPVGSDGGHLHLHPHVHDHAHDHADGGSGERADGGDLGELATPTGIALLVALGDGINPGVPGMPIGDVGIGAGTRDPAGRANIVRVVLHDDHVPGAAQGLPAAPAWDDDLLLDHHEVWETNVDDLDPRAWPGVVAALLEAGARDAWLTPVHMKKGRAGHMLSVLVDGDPGPEVVSGLREVIFTSTGTLGVREHHVRRLSLPRTFVVVPVECGGQPGRARIKVGHRGGVIVHATPEFEDVAELARRAGRPVLAALEAAQAAAHAAGLVPGAPLPPDPAP